VECWSVGGFIQWIDTSHGSGKRRQALPSAWF
jgi:hypothetical protein